MQSHPQRLEGGHPALAELPLEVLEAIANYCSVPERVALTSCCKGVWVRPDVRGSARLWGDLRLGCAQSSATSQGCTYSLATWLARRRAALRALHLGPGLGSPVHLLFSLRCGGRLQEVGLHDSSAAGVEAAVSPLQRLPLTRLELSGTSLQHPLQLLPLLGTLRALRLRGEQAWGRAGEAGFEPLLHLTALTALELSSCGLERLPRQLSALAALADLCVAGNSLLGRGAGGGGEGGEGEAAFGVLPTLSPSLSKLSIDACDLQRLPRQLSSLCYLAELSLDGNASLGDNAAKFEGGVVVFQPLARLGTTAPQLTRLSLRGCNLEVVPAVLADLPALRNLCLSGNPFWMGGRAAFQPLGRLRGLRHLALAECGLQSLPAQLAELGPGLEELELEHNPLGGVGEGSFRLLHCLGGLRRVDARRCDLRGCPHALGPLLARGVKVAWQ